MSGNDAHNEMLKHIPQWFVAVFALVYLSGYLIDFFNSSAFGIPENGGDVLKLKYIETGLNFVVLVLIVSGPSFFDLLRVVGMIAIHPDQSEHEARYRVVRFFVGLFTISYTLSIYMSFLFSPWHYFSEDPWRIAAILLLIFFVQITYILFTGKIEKRRLAHKSLSAIGSPAGWSGSGDVAQRSIAQIISLLDRYAWAQIALCLVLFVVTLGADYRAFSGLRFTLLECFLTGKGWIFFAFCVLLAILFYRAIGRIKDPPVPFLQYIVVMISSTMVIYYLTLVSYAYFIFPYIPNVKGGADFTRSSYVDLILRHDANGPNRIGHVVYIYSGASAAYFATVTPQNGPCNWRRREASPHLIAIEYRSLERIETSLDQERPRC